MELGNKGHWMVNSCVMLTHTFKRTKIFFHLLDLSIMTRCTLCSSCGAKMSWDFRVSWWEIFRKAGTVGWIHSWTRGRPNSTATSIQCLSQRGNTDWLVNGMCTRCFMCSAHTLSSQNIQVLSAKLDCALPAVKTTTLTCAENCSQQKGIFTNKHE